MRFSDHAIDRMRKRKVTEAEVKKVLINPDFWIFIRSISWPSERKTVSG